MWLLYVSFVHIASPHHCQLHLLNSFDFMSEVSHHSISLLLFYFLLIFYYLSVVSHLLLCSLPHFPRFYRYSMLNRTKELKLGSANERQYGEWCICPSGPWLPHSV